VFYEMHAKGCKGLRPVVHNLRT